MKCPSSFHTVCALFRRETTKLKFLYSVPLLEFIFTKIILLNNKQNIFFHVTLKFIKLEKKISREIEAFIEPERKNINR